MELLLSYLNSIHELSPPLREHLTGVLRQRSLTKKELLLKAGHVSRYIYFIEKGIFRCFYIRHNQEICSWFMKEGDVIVSVESFFTQKESYESIQALEECVVHCISYDDLQYIEASIVYCGKPDPPEAGNVRKVKVIPLILVFQFNSLQNKFQNKHSKNLFVIEEPELNLYPTSTDNNYP